MLGLVVTEGWCLALIALNPRPFDALHWVATGDGIAFQEVIEEAGQCRQLASDGGTNQAAFFQIGAPS
ncbi:hypothetical protein CU665_08410 [Pseudomonas syringae pv. actinidifoliorum]|nr:hypothetical protein [Pseudomonas syringae pv. actinidifoliorum]NAT22883.1 hypothetical protein [Pseudomonas syringae pv. actinidifoliorum]NAT38684.1 hypothetical protein [Pseudomonas syringae pv. actinidifoliorum]NAT62787.1 hypothetical protein [Pseudomonas syringae pv. actinidifoliorum]